MKLYTLERPLLITGSDLTATFLTVVPTDFRVDFTTGIILFDVFFILLNNPLYFLEPRTFLRDLDIFDL